MSLTFEGGCFYTSPLTRPTEMVAYVRDCEIDSQQPSFPSDVVSIKLEIRTRMDQLHNFGFDNEVQVITPGAPVHQLTRAIKI